MIAVPHTLPFSITSTSDHRNTQPAPLHPSRLHSSPTSQNSLPILASLPPSTRTCIGRGQASRHGRVQLQLSRSPTHAAGDGRGLPVVEVPAEEPVPRTELEVVEEEVVVEGGEGVEDVEVVLWER